MLLGKEQGGTTVHGHTWDNDGDEVEVPYELAMELLAIKGGGFYVPEGESHGPGEEDSPGGGSDGGEEEDGESAAKPARPRRKPAAKTPE